MFDSRIDPQDENPAAARGRVYRNGIVNLRIPLPNNGYVELKDLEVDPAGKVTLTMVLLSGTIIGAVGMFCYCWKRGGRERGGEEERGCSQRQKDVEGARSQATKEVLRLRKEEGRVAF